MCAVRLSYSLSSGFCCVCRRPVRQTSSGLIPCLKLKNNGENETGKKATGSKDSRKKDMQALPGTRPSYIMSTICCTWYVQAPGNVLQAVVLITRQLALEGDRQENTKKRKSWYMEPNDLSAGLSAMARKKSNQEIWSTSWKTCQVCLTPPVLHSSVFSRWICGCVYTHTHIYIYIYMWRSFWTKSSHIQQPRKSKATAMVRAAKGRVQTTRQIYLRRICSRWYSMGKKVCR